MRQMEKVLAVGAVWALLMGWAAAPASAAEKVLFILDWAHYGGHVGFFNALEAGFFREAGLDVTIQRGNGSGDTIKRIGTKDGQFGFADTGTLVVARGKGARVKSLGVLHNKEPHSMYALKSSGIRTVKDLEGKHFGDAEGGSCYALFPALAQRNGVKNWKFTNFAPTAKYAVLLAKKVDFICTYAEFAGGLRVGAAKSNDEVVELRWSDYGLQFHGNGVVAHDDTIAGQPALAGRFVNAAFRGVADAVKHRGAAVDRFLKHAPAMDRNIILQAWDVAVSLAHTEETKAIGVGGLSREKMNATIDLITRYMKLPSKAKVSDIYAPQFLKKILP